MWSCKHLLQLNRDSAPLRACIHGNRCCLFYCFEKLMWGFYKKVRSISVGLRKICTRKSRHIFSKFFAKQCFNIWSTNIYTRCCKKRVYIWKTQDWVQLCLSFRIGPYLQIAGKCLDNNVLWKLENLLSKFLLSFFKTSKGFWVDLKY